MTTTGDVTVPMLSGERRFPITLVLFGALSLMAHAATFFLFQVAYPPHVTIPPGATQVALISADDPEQQALLRWIESEDPALIASSAHPVPPRLLQLEYEPSYNKLRTAPRTMPQTPERPERPPGPELSTLLRSIAPRTPAVERQMPAAQTLFLLSGGLAERNLLSTPPSWKVSAPGPLQEIAVLLGVSGEGGVRYAALQKSSGDHKTDAVTLAQISRLHFNAITAEPEVTWGFATIVWGDDAYSKSAEVR